jgi:hypothetical protein
LIQNIGVGDFLASFDDGHEEAGFASGVSAAADSAKLDRGKPTFLAGLDVGTMLAVGEVHDSAGAQLRVSSFWPLWAFLAAPRGLRGPGSGMGAQGRGLKQGPRRFKARASPAAQRPWPVWKASGSKGARPG